jgi:hypothetical protein
MTVFRCSAADFRITGDDLGAGYATARNTGNYVNAADNLRVGQSKSSGHYYVYRSFLRFDTSSIPDGDTVTAVTLGLKIAGDYTTFGDFILYPYKYNWKTSPTDDVYDMGTAGATDAEAAVKDGNGIDISGKTGGDWVLLTGLATDWINKTGNTNYALRSHKDADGSGSAPVGAEYLNFYSGDYATATYRPYLDVAHGAVTGSGISRLYAQGVLSPTPFNQLG